MLREEERNKSKVILQTESNLRTLDDVGLPLVSSETSIELQFSTSSRQILHVVLGVHKFWEIRTTLVRREHRDSSRVYVGFFGDCVHLHESS